MIQSKDPVEYEINGDVCIVEGIDHKKCQDCGETFFCVDALVELRRRANREYKRNHRLLTGSEIRSIRKKLGVNQNELEQIIKAGKKSFTRWESDKIIQSGTADSLLRILEAFPEALTYLKEANPMCRSNETIAYVDLLTNNKEPKTVSDCSRLSNPRATNYVTTSL